MSNNPRADAENQYPLRISSGRDEKSWAKRFVHRFQNGDQSLTTIQIHFSHMALDLPIPGSENNR